MFLFTGERRFERAVQEAALLQQTNGHAKMPEARSRGEIPELTVDRRRLSLTSAAKVAPAKASVGRVANIS